MIAVKELANELGVSRKTIYAMVDDGIIPCYRIGCGRGTLRFDLEEVRQSLRFKTQERLDAIPPAKGKHLK